jgi:hypothetical protein
VIDVVVTEATLIAQRAEAGYQLGRVLGIPSRWVHRRADHWIGAQEAVDDALRPDVVLRWR